MTSNCSSPTAPTIGIGHHRLSEEDLRRALFRELAQSLIERFATKRILGDDPREVFWSEARDPDILGEFPLGGAWGLFRGEGITDAQRPAIVHPDDIARQRLLSEGAFTPEELLRWGELEALPRSHMGDLKTGDVAHRADAHEGDAVAMPRIHVCLHLEDEAGEGGIAGGDGAGRALARDG